MAGHRSGSGRRERIMRTPRLIPDTEMRGLYKALLKLEQYEPSGLAWLLTAVQVANKDAVKASEGTAVTAHDNPLFLLDGPASEPRDLIEWMRDIRNNTISANGTEWLVSAAQCQFEDVF